MVERSVSASSSRTVPSSSPDIAARGAHTAISPSLPWQKKLGEMDALGATLVALTPEYPEVTSATADEMKLGFEVLSDLNHQVAEENGLVFTLNDETAKRYQDKFKLIDRLMTEDFVITSAGSEISGRDAFKQWVNGFQEQTTRGSSVDRSPGQPTEGCSARNQTVTPSISPALPSGRSGTANSLTTGSNSRPGRCSRKFKNRDAVAVRKAGNALRGGYRPRKQHSQRSQRLLGSQLDTDSVEPGRVSFLQLKVLEG